MFNNRKIRSFISICVIMLVLLNTFSIMVSAELINSTVISANTSGSTQSSGHSIAATDGSMVNYTYTGKYITSTASLYDYISDKEYLGQNRDSIASGYTDPYTRFNTAISANQTGDVTVSPAVNNLTIRFKTHVNGLTKAYVYLFDNNGHSTGWSDTPLTWDASLNEWNHTFIYDELGFTPTKIIYWGDSSYGEWQTDDITCALAKGSSYLYDDAKEVTGTANRISVSIPIANARVTAVGGINKRDQKLHLRKKSSSNVQVNMYGGYSGKVNMTESSGSWVANNMNVSSASGDITVSIRSDGYWDKDGNARTGYYAETVPFVVTKGHNYTFNDWGNLTTGTAYNLMRANNVLYAPLYFGCFYRGDNASDYKLGNKANYSSFWWLPNMSIRDESDAAVQGLIDDELDANGNPTQDNIPLPYFDSTWVSGDASRAGLMESYEDLDFPFYEIKVDATTVKGDANATGYATYYQFNSRENYVKYDSISNTIVETSTAIHSQGTQSDANGTVGFYPFNDVDNNTKLNLGFGAKFTINFKLTEDGKVETLDNNGVKTGTYVDALFEFIGDDDVWVFIDDKLILDMGGCHKDTSGVINFATRKAYVNNAVTFIKEGGDTPTNEDNLGVATTGAEVDLNTAMKAGTFENGVYTDDTHVLTLFYMERGMFESDLLIRYNFDTISNTNTFKVREVTKFKGVNAGLMDATKKAAEYDVWQYQIQNTSTENGNPSGILTPTYDTYTRTNQRLTSKLSGATYTKAIYLDKSAVPGWSSSTRFVRAWVGGRLYVPTAENGNIFTFTGLPDDADKVIFYRMKNTSCDNSTNKSTVEANKANALPEMSFIWGDVFGPTNSNAFNEGSWLRNELYTAHNYVYNASDTNHYVNTVNYIWSDRFATRAGTVLDDLKGTTSATGIFSLMYGTADTESSAEFQKQFTRGSTMTVTQLTALKTPEFDGNNETFTSTLDRNYTVYYNTNVIVKDAVSNVLTRTGNTFIYDNKSGVSEKTPVQIVETFENTPKLGAITVTKTLQKNDIGNANNRFKMQLELKDIFGIENNNISDYDDIEANVDIDADGYFYMIGGQTVVISGVPYGTQYKITEVDSGNNYTQISNTMSGYEPVYEGSVTDGQSSVASNNETIVNVRKLGSLTQTKTVSSAAYPTDKTFSFTITINAPTGVDFSNYNTVFTNGLTTRNLTGTTFTTTYTLAPGDSISVSNLPYESTYQIVEAWSQDWTLIENNGWSGTISNSTPSPSVNFINRYDGVEELTIDKQISNYNATRDASKTFTYTFNINGGNYNGNGVSYTKSDSTSGTLNNASTFTLGHNDSIVITVPYGATCRVTEATNSDYTCTSGNYSGILMADDSFTFINHYDIPVYSLTINKVVEDTDANDDFTFTIGLNANSVDDDRAVSNISITAPTATETLADKGYTGEIGGHSYSVVYTIKKNQSIVISGIPEGTICIVSEAGVANYTAVCSGAVSATGTKGQSLSVNTILDSDQTLTFTNTYNEDAFSPYVLPAAGLGDMSGIIIITFALMGLCGFTFFYVNRKEED